MEAQTDAHNAKLLETKAGHAKDVDAMQQEVAAKEQQAVRLQEIIDARAKVCLCCSSTVFSLLPAGGLALD